MTWQTLDVDLWKRILDFAISGPNMENHRRPHGQECDAARRDCSASRGATQPKMASLDAQDVDVSLDALAFDSSLSFLDNVDDLSDSMMALLDSDTAVPPLKVEKTTSAKPRGGSKPTVVAATTRARQKEELEYLRSQVVELEAELDQLKSDPESPSAPSEPSVWEKIAKRQWEEKQRAAVENAKLRELLEGQLKVARSLEKLLNKRGFSGADGQFTERKRLRTTEEMDVSAVVEEIRGRIHLQFNDVDAVMDECGLSCVFTDTEDAQATMRSTADHGICMEALVVKVLPFPVAEVADVVWKCTSAGRIELANGYFGASQRSETTCDLQFAVKMQLRRAEAVVRVRGVGARRIENDRSLIVFESTGRTEGKLFEHYPILCRERGYVSVEKNETSRNASGSSSTIVKVCVRLWPDSGEEEEGKPGASLHFRSFIDLVIGSYNQNTKTFLQLVENLLLEQSLAQTQTVV